VNVGCGELKEKAPETSVTNKAIESSPLLPTFDAFTLGNIDAMVNAYWFINLKQICHGFDQVQHL
jgi:hypothetical protein